MAHSDSCALPQDLLDYCDRATVALSIAAADQTDAPLVYVNDRFLTLTGYDAAEVLDRNCRFLQGADCPAQSRREIHDFIADDTQSAGRFRITNQRKGGATFENFVFMSRLRDADGRTRLFLGSQFDLTEAMKRSQLEPHETALSNSLTDLEAISRGFGLAMIGSAKVLSESVATMATIIYRDGGR